MHPCTEKQYSWGHPVKHFWSFRARTQKVWLNLGGPWCRVTFAAPIMRGSAVVDCSVVSIPNNIPSRSLYGHLPDGMEGARGLVSSPTWNIQTRKNRDSAHHWTVLFPWATNSRDPLILRTIQVLSPSVANAKSSAHNDPGGWPMPQVRLWWRVGRRGLYSVRLWPVLANDVPTSRFVPNM